MKAIFATAGLVIGTLMAAASVYAADPESDRSHPLAYLQDSAITAKIKAKLADEKMSSLVHIDVDTDGQGAVVLSGNVQTKEEADKAVAIARATEGVTSVRSDLKIKKSE